MARPGKALVAGGLAALLVGALGFGQLLTLGVGFSAGKAAGILAASALVTSDDGGTYGSIKAGTVPAELIPLYEKAAEGVSGCPAVTPVLLAAQGKQESRFNERAVSPAGAQGIAQFLPATFAQFAVDGDGDGKKDIWNPADAIPSQAAYDCHLSKILRSVDGDPESIMLAGYNAGPGSVVNYGGVPPFAETRTYIKNIKQFSKEMAAPQDIGSVDSGIDGAVPAGYPRLANGLGPNAERGRRIVEKTFGVKIAVGSCVHATDSMADSYHLTGHACDVMTYSNSALGFKISRWAKTNAAKLGVTQVIFNQQIWTTQRDSEGWRPMSDRGSVSANHKDHVHLSFDRSRTAPVTPGGSVGRLTIPSTGVFSASVTSVYGRRFHPVLHIWKLHDGTDFGAGCGTPIQSIAAGTVVSSKYSAGYGNQVRVSHGMIDGHRIETSYSHMSKTAVKRGSVAAGEVLGFVGSTGFSTACHLHFMVYVDGKAVNPLSNPYVRKS